MAATNYNEMELKASRELRSQVKLYLEKRKPTPQAYCNFCNAVSWIISDLDSIDRWRKEDKS